MKNTIRLLGICLPLSFAGAIPANAQHISIPATRTTAEWTRSFTCTNPVNEQHISTPLTHTTAEWTRSFTCTNPVNEQHISTPLTNTTAEWTRSSTGAWRGAKDGITYWYKLDKQPQLWWSLDGKEWEPVKDGMWADKEGKWFRRQDKMLVWTTDGNQWTEVPEWKWEGADGKWYKFDANWELWVKE